MAKVQILHKDSFDPPLARTTVSVGFETVGSDTEVFGAVGVRTEVEWVW